MMMMMMIIDLPWKVALSIKNSQKECFPNLSYNIHDSPTGGPYKKCIPVLFNKVDRNWAFIQEVLSFIINKERTINKITMQQCLKRFIPRAPRQQWPQNQIIQLKQIVKKIKPNDSQAWKEVCLEMHQHGFRRTLKQYKIKGINLLLDSQGPQIKISPQKLDQILQCFEQGHSVKDLSDIYLQQYISPQKLRAALVQKFESMNNFIRKVVGVSKLRPISVQDCYFFSYIRSKNEYLPPLTQVARKCQQYKEAFKRKNQQQRAKIEEIQRFLENYNSILKRYTPAFEQMKKQQTKLKTNLKKEQSQSRQYRENNQSIPFRHLSTMSAALQVAQSEAIFNQDSIMISKEKEVFRHFQTMPDMSSEQCRSPRMELHDFQGQPQLFLVNKPTEIENYDTVQDLQNMMNMPWSLEDFSSFKGFCQIQEQLNNQHHMELCETLFNLNS